MKLIWLTDTHLNFLEQSERMAFYKSIIDCHANGVVITGDIAESGSIVDLLKELVRAIQIPIYFVLGNHDFYFSGVEQVKKEIKDLSKEESLLFYLSANQPICLTNEVILLGQDGWADGRYGDFSSSRVALNDSHLISELFQAKLLSRKHLLAEMQYFADADAKQLQLDLELSIKTYKPKTIVIATHVPPFKEASLFEGKQSDWRFQPFFSCKVIGDLLLDVADNNPQIEFLALCGHTHHKAEYEPKTNLKILVGHSEYYKPQIIEELSF